jgi:tRNA G18 (ribose-2'-O)-methylase SpoU
MEQLSHDKFKPAQYNKSVALICCELQSPANLGSICRVAEAFGVEKLYVNEENLDFLKFPRFIKTARHSHNNITIKSYSDLLQLIVNLQKEGYLTLALELCDKSQNLSNIEFSTKNVIIVGHEKLGIEQSILDKVDSVVHLEMYGKNSSINVAQAAGIALYQCVNSK